MDTDSWVFRVKAEAGESLGHYLGRFRRANHLSHRVIAEHLGIGVSWVEDWETPSRRRNPTELQLMAVSKLVEVAPKQLAKMLPPTLLHLQTRLCAACYAETPVHQAVWQRAEKTECDRHGLNLLLACPACETGFHTPALWDDGCCEECGLRFSQMQGSQARASQNPQGSPTPSPHPDALESEQ